MQNANNRYFGAPLSVIKPFQMPCIFVWSKVSEFRNYRNYLELKREVFRREQVQMVRVTSPKNQKANKIYKEKTTIAKIVNVQNERGSFYVNFP